MARRYIIKFEDDDILRKRSKPIKQIDTQILSLLDDMAETMRLENGAGLAAVQVGVLKRLAVIDTGEGLIKLINPEIIETFGEQQETEGCLSIPNIYGILKRPERVAVKTLNEEGEIVILEGVGLQARAFCHEIDHMDGILFIDKAVSGSIIDVSNTNEEL
ncbi:MAG: peptide deformylase [Eubacteriales bacterium]